MNRSLRRGACPGLSEPMPTGDGLLVRILLKDRVSPEAFIALCLAAGAHANGILEITSRGSVQVRGLTPPSIPLFASQVAALDIAQTHGVVVLTDPIPHDLNALIDAEASVLAVQTAIEAAGFVLAPKVAVVIDSGGRLHLDALCADVRLRAFRSREGLRWLVALGGDAYSATTLGAVAPHGAADTVVRLLGRIAACGRTARAADILRDQGIAPFRSAVATAIEDAPSLPARIPVDPIGMHPLRNGRLALGIALPFGEADAEALARLARASADRGAHALRAVPGRTLLVIGLNEDGALGLAAAAARLGFIVRSDDPRRRIAACPGKPACASGWIEARVLAREVAQRLPARAGDIDVHISGCAKGCAHPSPAALTIVGSDRGCGIIHHGSTRATPRRYVGPGRLVSEIVRSLTPSGSTHG